MQVKKFEAPTVQEALDTVKRELGPEAVILQTKKNKKGFGLLSRSSIEVTAAVSERSLQKKKHFERALTPEDRSALHKLSASEQNKMVNSHFERVDKKGAKLDIKEKPSKNITAKRYIDIPENESEEKVTPPMEQPQQRFLSQEKSVPSNQTIEQEVQQLKELVKELRDTQDSSRPQSGIGIFTNQSSLSHPNLQNAFEQLVVGGVEKRHALEIIKNVSFELGKGVENLDQVLDQVATELMSKTEVAQLLEGVKRRSPEDSESLPQVVSFVGPTGVGKTTTIAKIASEAVLDRKLKVGLINLDTFKIAAREQLETYAKILSVPYRSVSSGESLRLAIQDFKGLDLIIVDTTGRSQRDTESLRILETLVHRIPNVRNLLVVSATTRDAELYDTGKRFSIFRPEGIIVSKLDESMHFGSIYSLSQKLKLPLYSFTTGQRVPEDIEAATPERVAALILDL